MLKRAGPPPGNEVYVDGPGQFPAEADGSVGNVAIPVSGMSCFQDVVLSAHREFGPALEHIHEFLPVMGGWLHRVIFAQIGDNGRLHEGVFHPLSQEFQFVSRALAWS